MLVNVVGLVTVVLEWGQRGPEHKQAGRLQGLSLGNGDLGQPGGPLPHGHGPLPHGHGHAAHTACERQETGSVQTREQP